MDLNNTKKTEDKFDNDEEGGIDEDDLLEIPDIRTSSNVRSTQVERNTHVLNDQDERDAENANYDKFLEDFYL